MFVYLPFLNYISNQQTMSKNLVIVESPAKAKTIEGFLGKDFTVKSCYGHVRDLSKTGMGIDIKNNYSPIYEVSPDKEAVIKELSKLASTAEMVWLASDEDREGEAISWHLSETLKLDQKKTKRIVFHEITKPAILKAIENPRSIDYNLVNAQQARRILDRLVGFELSPVLWKKVKPSLSAGRVQSVAVRLLVEREREIINFSSVSSFKVTAEFEAEISGKKSTVKARLPKNFDSKEAAEAFLKSCMNKTFEVDSIEKKPTRRSPAPPFTTSTLQQEASRKLGFSVSQTMVVAQKLYESGKITYMRTDSVNLSETALQASEQEIKTSFGDKFHKKRQYATKSKGAQEAHEAIRPTYFNVHQVDGDSNEKKLYDLIWKRAIASQMADAELEKTTIKFKTAGVSETFEATGEVIKFEGFLKVYLESSDDDTNEENNDALLPPLEKGDKMLTKEIVATQRFSQPPPRYTEASLVKKMEELGIGRPSTYAPTISTILKRNYAEKGDREAKQRNYDVLVLKDNSIVSKTLIENFGSEKSKLFPTDIGIVVNDFLAENFGNIIDYNFTATVEKEFDEIAEGLKEWTQMIDSFYNPFHKDVEKTIAESERARGARLIGVDPESGKNVYGRIGRYGPLIQIGENDDENKKFANLRKGQLLDAISLEESLELFKLPRSIGEYEDSELVVAVGRFGPYIKHKNAFYSLAKTDDPYTIDTDRAIEIIESKRNAEKEKVIKVFSEDPDVQILNGRFGPYISKGKENFKIPKDKQPSELTYSECVEIMSQPKPERKGRFASRKKS